MVRLGAIATTVLLIRSARQVSIFKAISYEGQGKVVSPCLRLRASKDVGHVRCHPAVSSPGGFVPLFKDAVKWRCLVLCSEYVWGGAV